MNCFERKNRSPLELASARLQTTILILAIVGIAYFIGIKFSILSTIFGVIFQGTLFLGARGVKILKDSYLLTFVILLSFETAIALAFEFFSFFALDKLISVAPLDSSSSEMIFLGPDDYILFALLIGVNASGCFLAICALVWAQQLRKMIRAMPSPYNPLPHDPAQDYSPYPSYPLSPLPSQLSTLSAYPTSSPSPYPTPSPPSSFTPSPSPANLTPFYTLSTVTNSPQPLFYPVAFPPSPINPPSPETKNLQ
eukprot:Phypoly_transcript_16180.p1 GENE.Phypoly_transcript_16180~~Phypoly_transcript_16180.p1  ORF type:complete len:253 (-),score=51.09 Phypoly_transcript_16180:49-807(-)